MGDIVIKVGDENYCLNNKVEILWVDKTFGVAKVYFVEEGIERIVGIGLIKDKLYQQSTLCLQLLMGVPK